MENTSEIKTIELDGRSLKYLNTIRKWAMFLAIMGFIFLGLIIIIGLIAGTFLKAFDSGEAKMGLQETLIIISLFVMVIVYLFPIIYLFRFSKHSANAIEKLDKEELRKAMKNLRSYFVYIGILIIAGLSLYVITLVAAGTSMSFLKGL